MTDIVLFILIGPLLDLVKYASGPAAQQDDRISIRGSVKPWRHMANGP